MLSLILIGVGILLRFAPHAPNFTPVAAIALFGGVYLKKKYALITPLALMMVSDLFIGLHEVILFTWGGFLITVFLGFWIRRKRSLSRITIATLSASLIFFLVSNFGVWIMGWYPRTLNGIITCYIMAIPFLRNFTLATFLYVAVFFGAYEFIARAVKDTKLSRILLTN